MATKPGVVTASTGSGAAAGGSVSVGTAGKVTPKGSTEVDGLWTPESRGGGFWLFGCDVTRVTAHCEAFLAGVAGGAHISSSLASPASPLCVHCPCGSASFPPCTRILCPHTTSRWGGERSSQADFTNNPSCSLLCRLTPRRRGLLLLTCRPLGVLLLT